MNMRKLSKIINFTMIIMIIMNIISIFQYEVKALDYGEMMNQSQDFLSRGKNQTSQSNISVTDMTSEFIPLAQILMMIGAGVMVAVTTYMGIKYLTAGPDAQAKLKQQLIGVVVSGVVVFGAYGIWSTVLNIVKNFE